MGTIRIGYACINTTLPSPNRTCRLENATPDRILELARENISNLERILHWNEDHQIRLFRISSEIIPFASHRVNTLAWWEILGPELRRVGNLVREYGMRVSMHPGQFTVLNSLKEQVVLNSIAELEYHARLLHALELDDSHKIILHLGGTYGDKVSSLERLAAHFARLSKSVARRLVWENDERSYTLADALMIANQTGSPVVFDVLHHSWNPSFPGESLRDLVDRAVLTWGAADGPPKLHYSDQWPGRPPGSHSASVDVKAFLTFYYQVQDLGVDIMLEVKDKEQSVLAVYNRL